MLDLCVLGVVRYKIIVFVVPHEAPRAYRVKSSVSLQLLLLVDIPFEILKPDLFIRVDGLVEHVYIIIYTLIHRLNPPGNQDLAVEMMGIVPADIGLKLLNELPGFVLCDGQLKVPCDKVVSNQVAVLTPDDIQTIVFQRFKIGVERLAVRGESLFLKP